MAWIKSPSLNMDSLSTFMKDIYIAKPDSRLTVKDIYEDFRRWIIEKYDIKTWNKISQRQVYIALKGFPEYPYVRFKEGFCLKGITYRQNKNYHEDVIPEVQVRPYLTLNILDQSPNINGVGVPLAISSNELIKVQHICPRIQGVILPTLGHKK